MSKGYLRVRYDSLWEFRKALKDGSYMASLAHVVDANPEWDPDAPIQVLVHESYEFEATYAAPERDDASGGSDGE